MQFQACAYSSKGYSIQPWPNISDYTSANIQIQKRKYKVLTEECLGVLVNCEYAQGTLWGWCISTSITSYYFLALSPFSASLFFSKRSNCGIIWNYTYVYIGVCLDIAQDHEQHGLFMFTDNTGELEHILFIAFSSCFFFSWSYSVAGRNIFVKLFKNISQVNTKGQGEECSYQGISKLTVTMKEELDGAIFMCSIIEAELGVTNVPANSDEVMLELKGQCCIVFCSQPLISNNGFIIPVHQHLSIPLSSHPISIHPWISHFVCPSLIMKTHSIFFLSCWKWIVAFVPHLCFENYQLHEVIFSILPTHWCIKWKWQEMLSFKIYTKHEFKLDNKI